MEYIKKEELIKGEVYRVEDGNFWMIGIVTLPNNGGNDGGSKRGNATYITSVKKVKVDQSWAYQSNYGRTYRLATSEEKHWLLECIKLNKFISYEEAMKTFIPEYVECIRSSVNGFTENKIYKIEKNWNDSINFQLIDDNSSNRTVIMIGSLWQFKPSTKEAYDAQFVVKEPEFVLPKLWHIIITTENYEILSKYFSNNSPHSVLYTKGIMGFYKENKLGHTHTQIKGYDWDFGIEITFEQFKKYVLKEEIVEEKVIEQPMTENKTELEIWLENTKSLNLSLEDLEKYIESNQTCNFDNIYMKLEGHHSKGRAKILFDKWNEKVIEPLPQFKIIEKIETITKVENNEGNQFFIGDVVKTEAGLHFRIIGFKYDENKTKILAIATDNYPEVVKDINDIEHYIEPKVEVEETLLEKAKRLYPVGTKFIARNTSKECIITTGIFQQNSMDYEFINEIDNTGNDIQTSYIYHCIYSKDKWAKIIK